jgi:hypothetical protein
MRPIGELFPVVGWRLFNWTEIKQIEPEFRVPGDRGNVKKTGGNLGLRIPRHADKSVL